MSDKVNILRPLQAYEKALKDSDQPRTDPEIPHCDDCLGKANPAWRDGPSVYCADCVPDTLRYPTRQQDASR